MAKTRDTGKGPVDATPPPPPTGTGLAPVTQTMTGLQVVRSNGLSLKAMEEDVTIHFLDLTAEEGRRQYQSGKQGYDTRLRAHAGKTIEVVNLLLHLVDRVSPETGEETTGVRIVLFLADGSRCVTSSKSFFHGLRDQMVIEGRCPPFSPAMRCGVKLNAGASGKDYLTCEPLK